MRPAALAIFVAALLAGCTTGTSVTTGYYTVAGTTSEQLDREIRRRGPLGGHAFAATEIKMIPDIRERMTPEGCRIESARINVQARITLPRWENRASANRDLRAGWDVWADYAKAHEDVHVRIAETYAREMERELKALPPAPACVALRERAQQVLKRLVREHHKAQLKFDADEKKRLARLFREIG